MDEITKRQVEILKYIVAEYTETGEPVGSEVLEKKYKLGVSPATIRNEMVALAGKGYLKKSHFSSGRVPSAKGYRYYISNIMQERELSTIEEVAFKNSLWDSRSEKHKLLATGTKILSEKTGLVAVSCTNDGYLYYAGVAHLFDNLNMIDISTTRELCDVLEKVAFWQQILQRFIASSQDVFYMLGEEDFADPALEPIASILGDFRIGETQGVIGLVGPKRMRFDVFIPQVRYFSHLLEEIAYKS
jgi:heat-inducible transcriptional repressor